MHTLGREGMRMRDTSLAPSRARARDSDRTRVHNETATLCKRFDVSEIQRRERTELSEYSDYDRTLDVR